MAIVHRRRWSAVVTYFVVFVERGQRKIPVNYARRQVGNKVYGGQSSHLPLKLNMAGVIPPIFASSIILLPATVVELVQHGREHALAEGHCRRADARAADLCAAVCRGDHLLLLLLHGAGVQQPRDGGQPEEERRLHSGHPSGRPDGAYIDKILLRLTLAGAVYITFVACCPSS